MSPPPDAEDLLHWSEQKFRLLVQAVKDYAIILLDARGCIASWNSGAEHINGYAADEVLGKHMSLFFPKEDLERGRPGALLEVALRSGRVEDEGWRVRKDGTRFWANAIITRLTDHHGLVSGFAKVTRDLSERRAAEQALRRSEESLSATLYSIGDGVIATDEHAQVTRLNPVAERLTGWSQAESVGRPVGEVFHIVNESTRNPAFNPVERVLKEGVVVGLANHTALISRDGTEFPIADSGAPIRDPSGAMLGAVLVFRDVSSERQKEKELRQSEERLRLMVASVRDYAIFMLDCDGHVTSWNVGAERIKGFTASEIIGAHVSRFYPEEEAAAGRPQRLLEAAARYGSVEDEGWRLRKNGTRFWANVVISAMRDDSGELIGFTKVTRDMSERRQLQAAEQAAAEHRRRSAQAEEALRDRDVFLSVAAHELRTPLTALQLKLEGLDRLLQKGRANLPNAEKVESRFDDALRQTKRLTELVERLLDVTRIAAGQLEIGPEPMDLAALVGKVSQDFREKASQSHTEIEVVASGDTHGTWDAARLEQVVSNLVSNALKYGERKRVSIAVDGTGSDVGLIVTDRGIGIASHDLERIFDLFERAAPVEHFAGLGLGLYVSRHIVEAHGGTIVASSTVGEGASFVVTLPRHSKPNNAPPTE